MALFKLEDIKPAEEKVDIVPGQKATGTAKTIQPSKEKNIAEAIGEIGPDQFIWVPSLGNWSAHNMATYLAAQIGRCEMWFSSWAISENPIRKLITNEHINLRGAVLSDRTPTECPAAHQLLVANLDSILLTKNHSKGFVLIGEELSVSVTMTANFTENRRVELYSITTNERVIEAHLSLYKTLIDEGLQRK